VPTALSLARAHQTHQASLSKLLMHDLQRLWQTTFGSQPPQPQDAASFAQLVAPVVQKYGAASGAVAADFYIQQRAIAAPAQRFRPTVQGPPPTEQIAGSVAWALRRRSDPSTSGTASGGTSSGGGTGLLDLDELPTPAFTDLSGAAQRLAAQPGRSTLEDAIDEDPAAVAWIRITDAKPCAFCAMLAGRGAVYESRDTALHVKGTRDPYHDHDQCTTMARFRDDPSPLPAHNQAMQDLWYSGPAYFSNADARNAMARALTAQRTGGDVHDAVFTGYEHLVTHDSHTVEEFQRRAQRGGRNGTSPQRPDGSTDPRFR
jgi:hypothetical protein